MSYPTIKSSLTFPNMAIGASRYTQQGAALIVVLMVLILILLAGAIAVRQSNLDLKLATADQINTLLLQGADGANVKLENMINGSARSQNYIDATADNGIFGYFFEPLNKNDEVIYCYNPRQSQAMITGAKIFRNGSTSPLATNTTGNCDPSSADSYLSARNTVLTQVSLKLADAAAATEGFQNTVIGQDVNNSITSRSNLQGVYTFDVRSTSALPAYNDPGSCFANSSVTDTTLKNCLSTRQVPSKQIYTQAKLEYASGKINCTPFGIGTGAYTETKCTVASR